MESTGPSPRLDHRGSARFAPGLPLLLMLALSACAGSGTAVSMDPILLDVLVQPRRSMLPGGGLGALRPVPVPVPDLEETLEADTWHHEEGVASYYGPKFHGRTTANGETFDMRAMTAAHRSLPFGTRIRVTNLTNGKNVVLRVNDRGPFIDGRILDVSMGAAEVLDFITEGLVEVLIEALP